MAKIAVIGAGLMGTSWAALFLSKGHEVSMADPRPGFEKTALVSVSRALASLGPADATPDHLAHLTLTNENARAVAGAEFIQENSPEQIGIKAKILAELDTAARPDAIIASSSSGILLTELQDASRTAGRLIIGHPFTPPHLIPLVEVVGNERTAPGIVDRASALYRSLGKRPIVLRKEMKGHVVNRLQSALWREAVHLVLEGVVSMEDIDTAVTGSFGLRLPVIGPNMNYALAGGASGGFPKFLDHFAEAMQGWWDDLGTPRLDVSAREILQREFAKQLGDTDLADVARRRDEWLLAVLKLLAEQSPAGDAREDTDRS